MAAQRLVWSFSRSPTVKVEQRPPSTISQYSTTGKGMSVRLRSVTRLAADCTQAPRKLPVLLFDIMDTIVRDPFYHDVPAFFGMSMKELLECKHPTAWVEFEKGLIDEMELARTFFKDGRLIDLEGLKCCMKRGYSYIEGVEELLFDLKRNGYEMHTATNYPVWFEIIEEKLKLSTYLSWTFCSCKMGTSNLFKVIHAFYHFDCQGGGLDGIRTNIMCGAGHSTFQRFICGTNMDVSKEAVRWFCVGKRKPDPDFYMDISKDLQVEPACCIFIDDRMRNVEAALEAGFIGIQFKNVNSLRKDLSHLGIDI